MLQFYSPVRATGHPGRIDLGRILSQKQLLEFAGECRLHGRRMVFTNGCFDLLHPGHIRLLEGARSLGNVLLVAINSDASVRAMKGPQRPIFSQGDRAEILAALTTVDAVTIFDEPTPQLLIAAVLPDVLVKGADWGEDAIVGRGEVEAAGGRVFSVPLQPGFSTSALVAKIRQVDS
jgi:rfaE bifunctional protein nucleotidyltransferase chain/domain